MFTLDWSSHLSPQFQIWWCLSVLPHSPPSDWCCCLDTSQSDHGQCGRECLQSPALLLLHHEQLLTRGSDLRTLSCDWSVRCLVMKWLVKFIPGTWWTVNFRSPRSNTWPSSILVTAAAETELSGSSTILLQHLATLSSSLLTSLQVWESPPQHWSSWLSCTCHQT